MSIVEFVLKQEVFIKQIIIIIIDITFDILPNNGNSLKQNGGNSNYFFF